MSLRVFNLRSVLTPTGNRPADAGNRPAPPVTQRPAGKGALSGLSAFDPQAAAAHRASARPATGAPTGRTAASVATQAAFVAQRPAALSSQPAVWPSSTRTGYGVHIPNVGTFLTGNLDDARALLARHGVRFDGASANATPQRPAPPLPPRPNPQPPAPPVATAFATSSATPSLPIGKAPVHPLSLTPGRPPSPPPSPPPTPPASPHASPDASPDAQSADRFDTRHEWLRMPDPADHRIPAALVPGPGIGAGANAGVPASLRPGRPPSPPSPPPTPPASPQNEQRFSMPWPAAQVQPQPFVQMPAEPVHPASPQPTFLPLRRHQTEPTPASAPEVPAPPATANTWPQHQAENSASRPWSTVPQGMQLKTWASPQAEALERLGGPLVLHNLQPMDKAHYAGEEFGTKFGTSVKYLDEIERTAYQVTIHNGRLYSADGSLFDTRRGASVFKGGSGSAIFVMDHKGNLYLSNHQTVGKFHHSSFLAGAPVAAAGEMVVHDGEIKSISRRSGHYKPTVEQLNQCANHLKAQGVQSEFEVLSGI